MIRAALLKAAAQLRNHLFYRAHRQQGLRSELFQRRAVTIDWVLSK